MKYMVKISMGLVGCDLTQEIDTERELGFDDESWADLNDNDKEDELYRGAKELVDEYVEWSVQSIEDDDG